MLRVQGTFTASSLFEALTIDTGQTAVIDLSAATFIEPAGLVAIAALSDRAVRQGRPVKFIAPSDFSVRNYLSRMRVGHHLDALFTDHGLPQVAHNPHPEELLELRQFGSEFDGEQLAELVYNKVVGDADALVPEALHASICELAANVTTHADVPHGFAAAQTYWQGGNRRIVFAVADGGMGVQQSLAPQYAPATAAEAVRLAVQYGVSGTGEPGRGSGLHDVMEGVVNLRGRFTIVSGDARLVSTGNDSVSVSQVVGVYPGTLIEGQLIYRP